MEENTNVTVAQSEYAGFWLRFVALLIDGIILGIVYFILIAPIVGMLGFSAASSMSTLESNPEAAMGLMGAFVGGILVMQLISILVYWLYFSILESSKFQATFGKMALGLKVTDMNGERISFGRATGRFFGKLISGAILMIGYIMAGFTERKQALHDMIASCLVVKK